MNEQRKSQQRHRLVPLAGQDADIENGRRAEARCEQGDEAAF